MSDEGEKTVPWSRFEERGARIKALEAELAAATGKLDTLSKEAESYKAQAAEGATWRSKHDQLSATYAEERALLSEGITDPEVIEAARWAYSRLPEAERKPFADTVKAWKEKPDTAPKIMQPHLAPPPAAQPQRPGLPPSSRGTAASSPAPVGTLEPRAVLAGAMDTEIKARLGMK